MFPRETAVISRVDLLKLILQKSSLQGRLMKWEIRFAPFSLIYKPLKTVKGQIMANFLADHTHAKWFPWQEEGEAKGINPNKSYMRVVPWTMFFYGLSNFRHGMAGVHIIGPEVERRSTRLNYPQSQKMWLSTRHLSWGIEH